MTDQERNAYVKTLKVALATSIIRSKPSHLTAREYAQHLAVNLKQKEVTWKFQVQKLREELEAKNQEILLLKLKTADSSSLKDGVLEEANTEDTGVRISSDDKFTRNCNFLASVVAFKSWHEVVLKEAGDIEFLKEKMVSSIEGFCTALDKITVTANHMKEIERAFNIVREIAEKETLISDELIQNSCVLFVKTVIKGIVNKNNCSDKLCDNLVKLSISNSELCRIVLENLVLLVTGYSQLLSDCDEITSLDVFQYNKMFFICNTLQRIVGSLSAPDLCYVDKLSQKLIDADLFSIGMKFPMYAHVVWAISCNLLELSCLPQDPSKNALWKTKNQ